MEDLLETTEDAALADRSPSELVKLIKKLRWIGMEEEAARVQILLARADAGATLLSGPWDTD